MLEPDRPPPLLVGGFIISPNIAIKAMVVMAQVVICRRDCGGDHGRGMTAGVAAANRRYADERGGESSVLGLAVDVVVAVLVVVMYP